MQKQEVLRSNFTKFIKNTQVLDQNIRTQKYYILFGKSLYVLKNGKDLNEKFLGLNL